MLWETIVALLVVWSLRIGQSYIALHRLFFVVDRPISRSACKPAAGYMRWWNIEFLQRLMLHSLKIVRRTVCQRP